MVSDKNAATHCFLITNMSSYPYQFEIESSMTSRPVGFPLPAGAPQCGSSRRVCLILGTKSYVCEMGKSMKRGNLAVSQ
jgi:hypothetical protein